MAAKDTHSNKLFVPSLAVAVVAVNITNIIVTLLLVEISQTFQVGEGIAVQIRTTNAIAEVVFGVLMGFLVMRFRHKSLLLVGVLFVAFSSVGSFLAPTLSLMLVFSFLEGSGSIMVNIMAFTLIGDSLPLNKKSNAVSWVLASGYVFSFVGTPMIDLFADMGSWREAFSLLVLPVSIVGLLLCLLAIPKRRSETSPKLAVDRVVYLKNFKEVFFCKSAVSCLIGGLLFTGTAFGVFAIAFYRHLFLISREDTVYILLVIYAIAIAGSLVAGRLGNRFSVKSLTVVSVFICGVSIICLFFAPNLWVALFFNFLCTWFIGVGTATYHCLALEQIPNCRGTMISLYRVFTGVGSIIAPAVGGALLVVFSSVSAEAGYEAVGVGIGALSIAAAFILHFLAKDVKFNT
jgi:MFS transporter, DHA1 family, inner membrane transport protein